MGQIILNKNKMIDSIVKLHDTPPEAVITAKAQQG
jgi:hypothetical protein